MLVRHSLIGMKGWVLAHAAKIIAISLVVAAMASAWDIWWHMMVGRDTFFEPPHLLLYGGILAAIIASAGAWFVARDRLMLKIALVLIGIPVILAPFDEIWHGIFGKEDLTSIWIIWSPPHVALALLVAAAAIFTFQLLSRDRDEARLLLGAGLGAVLVLVAAFLTIPLDPLGQHHLLGFWGVFAQTALIVGVIGAIGRALGVFGASTLTAIFSSSLLSMLTEIGERSENIVMLPHSDFLPWTYVFASAALGVSLDALRRFHPLLSGGVAGAAWSAILYFGGGPFLPAEFAYTSAQALQALVGGTLGGALGWYIFSKISQKF